MVAPVVEEGAAQRNVYLPKGSYTDGHNGNTYEGEHWILNYEAPIALLPHFIRSYMRFSVDHLFAVIESMNPKINLPTLARGN